MGRVAVPIQAQNVEDYWKNLRGELSDDQIRCWFGAQALVDTGASGFSLPKSAILQLGLTPVRKRNAITPVGMREVMTYSAVRLMVEGRECVCEVTEIAENCPPLVGQIPLELLDFLVDPGRQRLIPNPAYGGDHVLELM